MKALVAIKRVLDYNVKPKLKQDQSQIDLTNLKMSINPFDEIAVEEAVRLKEAGALSEIVVVSIGPEKGQDVLRTALALGADRSLLIMTDEDLDSFSVAKILKTISETEKPDLILLGKQAIDSDCNQTGQMLAGLLGWTQGTFVSRITLENHQATVIREVDAGLETLRCPLPVVLTTDLRLNHPRYPTLPNIMKAKQKPLQKIHLSELNIPLQNHHRILRVMEPPLRTGGGQKVTSVLELIEKLQQKTGVFSCQS